MEEKAHILFVDEGTVMEYIGEFKEDKKMEKETLYFQMEMNM